MKPLLLRVLGGDERAATILFTADVAMGGARHEGWKPPMAPWSYRSSANGTSRPEPTRSAGGRSRLRSEADDLPFPTDELARAQRMSFDELAEDALAAKHLI